MRPKSTAEAKADLGKKPKMRKRRKDVRSAVLQNGPSGLTASLITRPVHPNTDGRNQERRPTCGVETVRLDRGRTDEPMIQTRRESDVAADRSGNVLTNGELADELHASEHRWQQSRMKCDLRC